MSTFSQSRLRAPQLAWAGILLAFLFGLSIPKVSDLAVFGLLFLAIWQRPEGLGLRPSDAFTMGLFFLFLLAFFIPSAYYGFTDPFADLKDGLLLGSCYLAGRLWARPSTGQEPDPRIAFALAAGFTLFSALTTFANPKKLETFINPYRAAPNFWAGGETINGTVLGTYASLGLCLLPLALLYAKDEHRPSGVVTWRLTALALAILGLVSNLVMQNRSPYLALAAAFLACSMIFYLRQPGDARKKLRGLIVRLSPLGGLFLLLMVLFPNFMVEILFRRFSEQGIDPGGRLVAWSSILHNLPLYPFGGKAIRIGGIPYAHNLWLDVAYNSGALPLVLLLAFHLCHLPFLRRFFQLRHSLVETLVISSLGLSMLMGCMGEPIMDSSRLYFGATCFLLGWIKARSFPFLPSPASSSTRP